MRSRNRPLIALAATVTSVLVLVSCSSREETARPRGLCPVAPVEVVATVDQWGSIVDQIGGACASVHTVVRSSTVDPHEYEPTPADAAELASAQFVVLNGLGYDAWAERALATRDDAPVVVDAGEVAGRHDGDNPHVWYDPDVVRRVAALIADRLDDVSPAATDVIAAGRASWERSLATYDKEIARVRDLTRGRSYAATEPLFDDMARAVGLERATPKGYQNAAMNDADPAPGDLAAFEQLLRQHGVAVLVVSSQTSGATTTLLQKTARGAGIPVVTVTETLPDGARTFVGWQVDQLRALARAIADR